MLKLMMIPLAFSLATPAYAVSPVAHVPTTWPVEGAFDKDEPTGSLSTKGHVKAPVQTEMDRQKR